MNEVGVTLLDAALVDDQHRRRRGAVRPAAAGGGTASFAHACAKCPLRAQCTIAAGGRTISIGPYEQTLTDARARQADPAWIADYRGTRPGRLSLRRVKRLAGYVPFRSCRTTLSGNQAG